MKALVVGGTGPSGPHIVNGLTDRGYEVTVLHGGQHEAHFVRPVEHVHVDPHFAETLAPALQERSFDLAIVTYGRTRIVAELLKGKTRRLIAVSGSAAYAAPDDPRWGALGRPSMISEDSPLADHPEPSRFAHLIWLTEETIMRAQREGYYQATIFRYPEQYGPNALANADWSVVRRILDGRKHIIIPANAVMRKRGYPENTTHALLLAVDKPDASSGQIYNIRDEHQYSRRQHIEFIARRLNHDWEIVELPASLAGKVRKSDSEIEYDITKVRIQLGYRDVVAPEEALARSVDWLLKNRPQPGGEAEQQLGDAFAYDAEDELIREFRQGIARAEAVKFPTVRSGHMYRHPKKPGEPWKPLDA